MAIDIGKLGEVGGPTQDEVDEFAQSLIDILEAGGQIASVADVWTGASDTKFVTPKVFKDSLVYQTVNPTALNHNLFINGKATITANTTFSTIANVQEGRSGVIELTIGGAGNWTLTFPSFFDFTEPPVPSTTTGKVDYLYYNVKPGGTGVDCSYKTDDSINQLVMATAADIWAGTSATKTVTPQAIQDSLVYQTVVPTALNHNTFINGKATISANTTFSTIANAKEGRSGVIELTIGGAGNWTLTFPAFFDFGTSAPVPSTTTGKVDYLYYNIKPGATSADCSYKTDS